MNILADSNIPFVEDAFKQFGKVRLAAGRSITPAMLDDTDILLVRSVTTVNENLIKNSPVRFVGTATIGTDHVDLAYLKDHKISFTSAPGSNARSVAEYVATALIYCSRELNTPLAGKTLGIIGAGHVGSKVRALAQALGMHCLLNDPPLEKFSDGTVYVPLKQLLSDSDMVTLHVPLTKTGTYPTCDMADADFFTAMKPQAWFFNTSRGKVVNEAALRIAQKHLGCIVLDVWNNEPDISEQTLACTTIATPHIAGYSFDGKVCGTVMLYNAVCSFLNTIPSWQPNYVNNKTATVINTHNTNDPVACAILSAYPIMRDDKLLREIDQQSARGIYFEKLRGTYPQRLEFAHYTVQCSHMQQEEARLLQRMGFSVTLS